MATLKEIIYEKIVDANTQDSYLIHEEIWYIIPFQKGSWIHYTIKEITTGVKILWFLCGDKNPHKWPVQCREANFDLLQ